MDSRTRSTFHRSQALPSQHGQYESGRGWGMCALFGVAAMAALAGVVTLAMTTPLGAMMTGLNGPGLALAWFAALFCVSTVGVSWGANTLFWLMMKPSNTKGGLTGFLGGMGWIANMLSLPPKLDA